MTATLNEPDVDIEALWKASTETPAPPVDPPEMPTPPSFVSWNYNTTTALLLDGPWRCLRINPDRKEQWCKALRSGEWVQMRGHTGPVGHHYNKSRCAMGVLFELMDCPDPSQHQIGMWFGVRPEIVTLLTHAIVDWNDNKGKSFEEIANLIERKF